MPFYAIVAAIIMPRQAPLSFVRAKQPVPDPRVALKISFKKFIYMLILVQEKPPVHLYKTLFVEALAYSFYILLGLLDRDSCSSPRLAYHLPRQL